eukprot:m51a1_g8524 hypothetical protein (400) ;mRNA; r:118521-119963
MRVILFTPLLLLVPLCQLHLALQQQRSAAATAGDAYTAMLSSVQQQQQHSHQSHHNAPEAQDARVPEQQQQRELGQRGHEGVQCEEIDVVYTWVDSRTSRKPSRQAEEPWGRYASVHGVLEQTIVDARAESRTRDMGTLRYSLRALVRNAPWARNVFLVTDGQVPEWLNASSVTVVAHEALFPADINGSLPTANSNAIEANLHRIPGLSQCFLYLNDDVFLWRPLDRLFFVSPEGRSVFHQGRQKAPSYPGYLTPSWHTQLHYTNEVLSTRYGSQPRNYPSHSCYLWSRGLSEMAWSVWPEEMRATTAHQLRHTTDVVMSMMQLHEGLGEGLAVLRNASLHTVEWGDKVWENTLFLQKALAMNPDCLCLQDGSATDPDALQQLIDLANSTFPEKSRFEL